MSCQTPVNLPKTTSPTYRPEKLLVLPFKDLARLYGENATVRCPICGKVFTTGKVIEDADHFLTEHLISIINRHKGIQLISLNKARKVYNQLLPQGEKEIPNREKVVEIGRTLGANAVLVGYVYRFKDREGTPYSVDTPASVAFDIDLVDVKDGQIIWYGRFNETQQALTEDLFQLKKFIKRKGGWITAWEMAVSGLEEVFQTFPKP